MRLAIALLALLVLAPAAEAAAEERPPCRPKGARTLDGSGAVRVYAIRGRVVACAYATRRTVRLGRHGGDPGFEHVKGTQVRGRWAAWWLGTEAESSGGPFSFDRVLLADVRRGRVVDVGATGCDVPRAPGQLAVGRRVFAVALTGAGRLAWACSGGGFSDAVYEIHKYDADGPGLLDQSSTSAIGEDWIDPRSLALAPDGGRAFRGRVYWSRASGPRSADLR